jgi:hypothetical protein
MSDDKRENFELSSHEYYGKRLKLAHKHLEQLRASLINVYEKSSSKEAKQLEAAIDKIRLVQTSLHGRLLAEYREKSDDELLPIYLGRLPSQGEQ